jgi:hypothetical protein
MPCVRRPPCGTFVRPQGGELLKTGFQHTLFACEGRHLPLEARDFNPVESARDIFSARKHIQRAQTENGESQSAQQKNVKTNPPAFLRNFFFLTPPA